MIIERIDDVVAALRSYRSAAVLGASSRRERAAWYVPRYLQEVGWDVRPVNPNHAGETILGRTCVASLADLDAPVEVVDVFRRPEALPGHLDDILRLEPLPRLVWLQQGIRNDAFARALSDTGIDVVQDRCMLSDHQRLVATRS